MRRGFCTLVLHFTLVVNSLYVCSQDPCFLCPFILLESWLAVEEKTTKHVCGESVMELHYLCVKVTLKSDIEVTELNGDQPCPIPMLLSAAAWKKT